MIQQGRWDGAARGISARAIGVCAAGLLCLALGGLALLSGRADAGEAIKVRFGTHDGATRIVIDTTAKVAPKIFSPEAQGAAQLILALPGTSIATAVEGVGQGAVETWVADEAAGAARFSFSLAGPVTVTRSFLLPPQDGIAYYRYVVDVQMQGQYQAQAAPSPDKKPLLQKVFATSGTGQKVIVIDAGHGGKDPGAKGVTGIYEKDVNLKAALELKKRLERNKRYKVVMVRETDVFIDLKDRVRIARGVGADLFISLHADSGPAGAQGASVYTLSEQASDRVADAITEKHDWFMDADYGSKDKDVTRILVDLTQRETKNQSGAFAQVLSGHLADVTPLLRNTHRHAGFVVLLAPDVPAILLEMGFLSHPEDEKRLTSVSHRRKMMDAVADSIDSYFETRTLRVASK